MQKVILLLTPSNQSPGGRANRANVVSPNHWLWAEKYAGAGQVSAMYRAAAGQKRVGCGWGNRGVVRVGFAGTATQRDLRACLVLFQEIEDAYDVFLGSSPVDRGRIRG